MSQDIQAKDTASGNIVPVTSTNGAVNVNATFSGSISGNAAAGPTGSAVPSSADYLGINVGGNLVGVSASNPVPITGSISATNPSVSTDNTTAPTSSTQIGSQDGSGKLQAASSSNPLPVEYFGAAVVPVSPASNGTTGSAVPSEADYLGFNSAGNLVGVSASNPLPVTGGGGGTQYATGSAVATPTGTAALGWDGTDVRVISTDSSGQQKVLVENTVPVSGTFWQATQPVSGTFWQTTQPVSGTFWQATQPVSLTSTTITGTVAVTESGTWTVQPGNTANTTPWLATINQGGNSATVTASNALKVDGSAVTQPVSGTFWQTTQPVSLTSTTITGSVAVTGTFWQTTQPVSLTSTTITGTVAVTESGTWTVQPGNTANTTPWLTTQTPATSGGLSVSFTGALSTTVTSVKSSAGQLYGWFIGNPNASIAYVQIFNTASGSVTLGTTAPIMSLMIPASGSANVEYNNGIAYGTAISIAATTTYNGSTAPGTGLVVNVMYK